MNRTKIEEMLKEAEKQYLKATKDNNVDDKNFYDGKLHALTSLLAEEGGEVKELYEKCPVCNGDGFTAEHNPLDPHEDGCTSCPIQVQCDNCRATGFVLASQHSPIVKDEWISVEERLPNDEPVLCLEGKNHRFVGFYTVGDLIEYDDYESGGFDEHLTEKEEKDQCRYLPKGWYEEQESRSNDGEFFRRKVTHWMPLPPAPSKGKAV